jgi:hypothetical protein
MIAHHDFPATLIRVGYSINNGFGQSPGFIQPASGTFRLCECAAARGRGMGVALQRPRPHAAWQIPQGLDLGAYQGERFLQPPADFAEPSVPDPRMDSLIAEARAAGQFTRRLRRIPT